MVGIGHVWALLGAALAVALSGIGSAIGLRAAGDAAAGVLSEEPDRFGQALVLQAQCSSQGIYGLLIAFIILMDIGVFGQLVALTPQQGLMYLVGALPIAVGGLFTAIYQGKTAASGIVMIGKRPSEFGKAVTLAAMVETYAVFALLISFLIINGIPV